MSKLLARLTVLMALLAAPAFAQRFTAAIRGTVSDPSDAVVAGAKVDLKNEATGLTRTASTNDSGNYFFTDLPVGSYQVAVTLPGFKTALRTGVVVNVADVREVNVRLAAGEMSESVDVADTAYSVETVGADISGLVERGAGARPAAQRPQLHFSSPCSSPA